MRDLNYVEEFGIKSRVYITDGVNTKGDIFKAATSFDCEKRCFVIERFRDDPFSEAFELARIKSYESGFPVLVRESGRTGEEEYIFGNVESKVSVLQTPIMAAILEDYTEQDDWEREHDDQLFLLNGHLKRLERDGG